MSENQRRARRLDGATAISITAIMFLDSAELYRNSICPIRLFEADGIQLL
jgi:hypothetical protein